MYMFLNYRANIGWFLASIRAERIFKYIQNEENLIDACDKIIKKKRKIFLQNQLNVW